MCRFTLIPSPYTTSLGGWFSRKAVKTQRSYQMCARFQGQPNISLSKVKGELEFVSPLKCFWDVFIGESQQFKMPLSLKNKIKKQPSPVSCDILYFSCWSLFWLMNTYCKWTCDSAPLIILNSELSLSSALLLQPLSLRETRKTKTLSVSFSGK